MDLLDRTAFTTRQTLQAAGLEWARDRPRAAGRRIHPHARRGAHAHRNCRGRSRTSSVSPDEAVAHGAALHAGLLLAQHAGRTPQFRIKNVNSHSLGVVATDPKTKRTRQRHPDSAQHAAAGQRPSGSSRRRSRSNSRSWSRSSKGESASPARLLADRTLFRARPAPQLPAQTPIEVRFRYLENGRLSIRVKVARECTRIWNMRSCARTASRAISSTAGGNTSPGLCLLWPKSCSEDHGIRDGYDGGSAQRGPPVMMCGCAGFARRSRVADVLEWLRRACRAASG